MVTGAQQRHEDRGRHAEPSLVVPIAVAAAATIAVAVLVGVGGDFPLSDDWSYAYSVRALCTDGVLRFSPWTGASLVLQSAYGAALCAVFGFSFTTLRLSTIVLAGSGVVAFFLLLRRCGVDGRLRTLAVVLLVASPLYVNLAFTFMTDVPFTVAVVWAACAYAQGLRTRRAGPLLVGSLAAAAALLIRQHGLLVALAAAYTAWREPEREVRARVRDVVAAVAVPAIAFAAFHLWLARRGVPGGYTHKLVEAWATTARAAVNCTFRGLVTVGFLLSPLAVALAGRVVQRAPRAFAGIAIALGGAALALYARTGAVMPYLTNVLYDLGLGALSLRDTLFLDLPPPVSLGPAFRVALTIVSILSAGVLLTASLAGGRLDDEPIADDEERVTRFVTVTALLLFAGTLLHSRYYFDRYLLPVLPFAIAAVSARTRRRSVPVASAAAAALLASYAIAGTHDYLAWNRARYAGLDALRAAGVPPTAIDGGVEFNAWHLAATLDRWPTDAQVRPGRPASERSWWWVVDDRFVASFRPLSGYRVREDLAYRRWLGPGAGHVLILERE